MYIKTATHGPRYTRARPHQSPPTKVTHILEGRCHSSRRRVRFFGCTSGIGTKRTPTLSTLTLGVFVADRPLPPRPSAGGGVRAVGRGNMGEDLSHEAVTKLLEECDTIPPPPLSETKADQKNRLAAALSKVAAKAEGAAGRRPRGPVACPAHRLRVPAATPNTLAARPAAIPSRPLRRTRAPALQLLCCARLWLRPQMTS